MSVKNHKVSSNGIFIAILFLEYGKENNVQSAVHLFFENEI